MSEEPSAAGDDTAPEEPQAKRLLPGLLAAAGVAGMLAFVLLLVFAALGLAGAMYWAVAVAAVGGIVMRRMLFAEAGRAQTLLFMAAILAGALGGLRLARALL